jgi:hypothetical protein
MKIVFSFLNLKKVKRICNDAMSQQIAQFFPFKWVQLEKVFLKTPFRFFYDQQKCLDLGTSL